MCHVQFCTLKAWKVHLIYKRKTLIMSKLRKVNKLKKYKTVDIVAVLISVLMAILLIGSSIEIFKAL